MTIDIESGFIGTTLPSNSWGNPRLHNIVMPVKIRVFHMTIDIESGFIGTTLPSNSWGNPRLHNIVMPVKIRVFHCRNSAMIFSTETVQQVRFLT
ncbi:hypothetical protein PoB_004038900 [Plakobranchus ocellatus]|uniref:Uncharacterized protein n=1 Tax=Plakobranchus ocellatus TaxID=259542 RepID=A0AAV4B5B2_9GAST|nr:hypothetical protein PoB_004038900 [Plakobranchus ocellatus]